MGSLSRRIERIFSATIRQYEMIKKGDSVAVALSGGKDSTVATYLLHTLQKSLPFDLFAITIDEGLPYRTEAIAHTKALCEKLRIPHHIYSFANAFGITIESIAQTHTNVCSYCGVFRRYLLNKKARELGAKKLVLAHTKDDVCQTFLMNILRNEPLRIARFSPISGLITHPKFVPRIRPLISISEEEVVAYAQAKNLPYLPKACPYRSNALRLRIVSFLDAMEKEYEGTKENVLQSYLFFLPALQREVERQQFLIEEIRECKQCGEPSSEGLCMACKMLKSLKG